MFGFCPYQYLMVFRKKLGWFKRMIFEIISNFITKKKFNTFFNVINNGDIIDKLKNKNTNNKKNSSNNIMIDNVKY